MQQTENSTPAIAAKGLQKKKKAPQCNVEDCWDLAEIILDLQLKQWSILSSVFSNSFIIKE